VNKDLKILVSSVTAVENISVIVGFWGGFIFFRKRIFIKFFNEGKELA